MNSTFFIFSSQTQAVKFTIGFIKRQFKSEVQQLFKAGGKGNLEIGQASIAAMAGIPSVKEFKREEYP